MIKMKIKTHKVKSLCSVLALSTALSASILSPVALAEDPLSSALSTQQKTDKASQISQGKVDNLSNQTQELLAEYKSVIRQVEALKVYNRQLQKVVTAQQTEIESMLEQIKTLDQTNIEITPLMLKMVGALEEFIELDVPFQMKERRDRVTRLQATLDSPNVTTSEKYRKILESYQIETDFGRTIEAYEASLGEGDDTRTYNFLRIGRVALLYQSLDGAETGQWNKETRQWEVLPESYRAGVNQGLKIARKQAPHNLIKLPVRTAEDA
ncbi:DUF3450 domain-containing protein [Endozoicomonas numazuensis]|uniref:DUF3450 domain-containing protein n=1 Tax=Endozoicomonas numazuensis TaxID=1137799 RepID=UPI000B247EA0|nr:DUF3450 domain-containing protein [Endozoicomonas numazuensis]